MQSTRCALRHARNVERIALAHAWHQKWKEDNILCLRWLLEDVPKCAIPHMPKSAEQLILERSSTLKVIRTCRNVPRITRDLTPFRNA
ncbi:hypothetical protein NDU88_000585 [Pleurodeles waltl]|uniref:Uncharacterized protein n=1 Tax=Pleurodeles waltl TaxID=8319 RepID=A0AAV7WK41_PLEWA|nr:hypothetical protein NDU88_000585 [Pleurodeles waltl]